LNFELERSDVTAAIPVFKAVSKMQLAPGSTVTIPDVSGDWDKYWRFHLLQEHQRNHLALYQGAIPLMKQVIQARCSITPPTIAIPV
jgi:hypothetical protein